uniref:Malonyl-CoA decarboxylase, mitochondrial n=1 Tax=Panagrellus redivivus TaxID=6233 RepID=A0A7E4UQB1_PANRE
MLKLFPRMSRLYGKPRSISTISTLPDLQSHCSKALTHEIPERLNMETHAIVQGYSQLAAGDRHAFISYLATKHAIDHESLKNAIAKYQRNENAFTDVHASSAPDYQRLFQSIGNLEGGVKFVCDFRRDVLDAIKKAKPEATISLRKLDATLKQLLTLWFCLSNLTLTRVTWETPADILQKIAAKEAVHPIAGLLDMKRRLGPGRRCFVFMHTAMPREPLVIVYVALTKGIASSVQKIVKDDELPSNIEEEIDSAIYYSISSTQPGLKSIDLGNLMIKNVAAELMRENPRITTHSTLSPIPGFRNWLLRSLKDRSEFGSILDDFSKEYLAKNHPDLVENAETKLTEIIESKSMANYAKIEPLLLHFAALHLAKAKNSHGFALNPVANFHLRNGAEIYRLNFAGNVSARGVEQACGLMVNYRYVMENVSRNNIAYIREHKIAVSDEFSDVFPELDLRKEASKL